MWISQAIVKKSVRFFAGLLFWFVLFSFFFFCYFSFFFIWAAPSEEGHNNVIIIDRLWSMLNAQLLLLLLQCHHVCMYVCCKGSPGRALRSIFFIILHIITLFLVVEDTTQVPISLRTVFLLLLETLAVCVRPPKRHASSLVPWFPRYWNEKPVDPRSVCKRPYTDGTVTSKKIPRVLEEGGGGVLQW